jgi:hypothetical protein
MSKKIIEHSTVNSSLIQELLNRFSVNQLSEKLIEILGYSRDAVYRRIRGDVPFTLNEAMRIAQVAGISLDSIAHPKEKNNVVFALNYTEYLNDIFELYRKSIETSLDYFGQEELFLNSNLKLAYNLIPSSFYLKYQTLVRFVVFKWMYQMNSFSDFMSELIIPTDILRLNKKRLFTLQNIENNEYVLDRHVFQSFVDDIRYFVSINLITKEELHMLKNELLSLIYDVETMATNGCFASGKRILIYISQVDFHFNYALFKSDHFEYSRIRLYNINYIYTHDPRVCRMHEIWINSLKKYSNLITQSGEIQRVEYFKKQREIVESMTL